MSSEQCRRLCVCLSSAIVATFLLCCASDAVARQTDELPKGRIIDRVECVAAPSQSYALFLPSTYSPDRKWPILFAFDPGARGRSPLEHFSEAAEKYGWILVGSNNSHNGPWPVAIEAWNAVSKDAQQRFAIDGQRVYLTGFSGGARVAIQIASLCRDCASGVIACGAGFPVGLELSRDIHFAFFGTTGTDDFNFPEVKGLDEPLAKAGVNHHIEVFDGRHEWPPTPVATAAVEWMQLQAMRGGKLSRDDAFINRTWESLVARARAAETSSHTYEAFQLYRFIADGFKGLHNTEEIERTLAQLRDSRSFKDARRAEEQQINKQLELERQLRTLIARRGQQGSGDSSNGDIGDRNASNSAPTNRADEPFDPATRLAGLITDLRKQSKATEDSDSRRIARRVLNGVFVSVFEQGVSLLQTEKRFAEAISVFKLATEINPDRAGAFFYLAWAHAANGDKKRALQVLSAAVDKGFSDVEAIESNKVFDAIRKDSQYAAILARVKKSD